jgi:hypothetical protein
MSTETSANTVDVTERLDAIVEQLDRIEEQLDKNTERTEVSASFVAEIHSTWELDVESGKVPKLKTPVSVGDRVSMGTELGIVQWFAVTSHGVVDATVAWDNGKSGAINASYLSRVMTQGI